MRQLCTSLLLSATILLTTGCFNKVSLFSFDDLLRSEYQEVLVEEGVGDKILLLDVDGVITSGPSQQSGLFAVADSTLNTVTEKLKKAKDDKSVKAVILRIDSPGGGVTASDVIYNEILSFKEETGIPVYASFLDMSASGGYYIGMAADEVYALPTTITGSIGVIAVFMNFAELGQKIGIKGIVVESGENKGIASPFTEMTPGEREILQSMIDSMFQRFLKVVKSGRPELSEDEIKALADGRPYTADQALENGLIDGILYLDQVIDRVREVERMENAKVVMYRKTANPTVDSVYAKPVPRQDELRSTDVNVGLVNVGDLSLAGSNAPVFYYLWRP